MDRKYPILPGDPDIRKIKLFTPEKNLGNAKTSFCGRNFDYPTYFITCMSVKLNWA